MPGLYPLKFKPHYLPKIWGGNRLNTILRKDFGSLQNCGESWELSSVEDYVSEVSNGFLSGNSLTDLIEVYMGDIVGEKVFKKYGIELPLLFKYIDANDDLSIQVHPNDKLSKERHNAYGKTEMWYVIHAEEGALINSGFNRQVTKEEYINLLQEGRLHEVLKYDPVEPGDVFFIPAGRVHAIGKGVLLAEIQQTSDVTYRIFDYNRTDAEGNQRELHTDMALDAIDFSYIKNTKSKFEIEKNVTGEIVKCEYFTTNLLRFTQQIEKDIYVLDSFVVYMNLQGSFKIVFGEGEEIVDMGETILVPASLESYSLIPLSGEAKVLEVYV